MSDHDPTSLAEGERRRDEGHEAALTAQEAWASDFASLAAWLLRQGRKRITSEDVIARVGMPPGHPNAVGAMMRGFAMRHSLRNVGTVKAARIARHAGRITVWEVQ